MCKTKHMFAEYCAVVFNPRTRAFTHFFRAHRRPDPNFMCRDVTVTHVQSLRPYCLFIRDLISNNGLCKKVEYKCSDKCNENKSSLKWQCTQNRLLRPTWTCLGGRHAKDLVAHRVRQN